MKRVVGALFVVAIGSLASAQSRHFWSQGLDVSPGLDDEGFDVVIGPGGQVFQGGIARNATDRDALFLAWDAYGRPLWQQRIDLGGEEHAADLAFDALSGDLYAVGTTTTAAGTHWVLWRFDGVSGSIEWQKDYLGPQGVGGVAYDVLVDGSGGIAVCGYSGSAPDLVARIARFDSAGALSWELPLSTPSAQYAVCWSLVRDPQGFLIAKSKSGATWTIHKLTEAGALVWRKQIGATENGAPGPVPDAASNLIYGINEAKVGGHVIAKLDANGDLVWSIDADQVFGVNTGTYWIAVDPSGEVLALASSGKLARLDSNGLLRWVRNLPPVASADAGFPAGLAVGPDGDAFVHYRAHTPGELLDLPAVASWDADGNFLWSQSVRTAEPGVEVRAFGLAVGAQDAVILSGWSAAPGSDPDVFVAGVRESSVKACFGDGSSGPCPCNNNVTPGIPSGCKSFSIGNGGRLDDQGISSLGSDTLRFFGTTMPGPGVAVLLQGEAAGAPVPFEDGILCLQGRVLRLYAVSFSSSWIDLAPSGAPPVHVRSAELGDPIQPGTARAYQLYFRSPLTGLCQPGNGNLTNSVIVEWAP
jgi:hypothetical protein